MAGDGILGGLLEPNDAQCHMEEIDIKGISEYTKESEKINFTKCFLILIVRKLLF